MSHGTITGPSVHPSEVNFVESRIEDPLPTGTRLWRWANQPRKIDQPPTGNPAYASGMEFNVLGPFEAHDGDRALPIGGPKQRSILAVLVANVGRPVSLDRIIGYVYEEDAAEGARHSVQTYISTIRRTLGDIVPRENGGYVLDVEPAAVDAVRFETLVCSALADTGNAPEARSDALREALGMWRGYAYAGVDGRGGFQPEITRLTELRFTALEARIQADLEVGRHCQLVGEIEALTVEHPLRERLQAHHMLALYRCSRQTEALRAYERTRRYLNEEIGIDPSPELRELERRILEHDPTLERDC